LPNLPFDLLQ